MSTVIEQVNTWGEHWGVWMAGALLDATVLLAVISLLWLAVRRRATPQLGYLLFLLVLLKLFVPIEFAIPERVANWTPAPLRWTILNGFEPSTDATDFPQTNARSHESVSRELPTSQFPLHAAAARQAAADRSPAEVNSPPDVWNPMPSTVIAASPAGTLAQRGRISAWGGALLVWAVIVVALIVRLLRVQARFNKVQHAARAFDVSGFPVDLRALCVRAGIRGNVCVVESDAFSSPAISGVFRPTLILPTGIVASLPPRQLEWVLLHELAHVRRRDLAVNCFQRLATILHFVNPAIWIANRVINRLREYACDDLASTWCGGSEIDSSEAFLGIVQFTAQNQHRRVARFDGALGVFGSGAGLACLQRMRRLLDTDRRMTARLGLGSLGVLSLTAILALPHIRAESPHKKGDPTSDDTAVAFQAAEKPAPESASPAAAASAPEAESDGADEKPALVEFSVVVARHVLLLDGKEIVTWAQIRDRIAGMPDPSRAYPHFYVTRGAMEAGLEAAAKDEMYGLHRDFKLSGHSEGSLWQRSDLRYDRIQSPDDLKPDESLRVVGRLVDDKDTAVDGAEVVLVTPVDDSIPYKSYHVALVHGRVRNPLEHVLTHTDERGEFTMYPPGNQPYYVLALHPERGFALVSNDQFAERNEVHLLRWSGLVCEFDADLEKQEASLTTHVREADGRPEIVLNQYWSDLKLDVKRDETRQPPTLSFEFSHVPPFLETTISRGIQSSDGGSVNLAGASVSLLPGETRLLGFGPLTEQQRKQLDEFRAILKPRTPSTKPDGAARNKRANPEAPSIGEVAQAGAADLESEPNSGRRFQLLVQGPDGKPVSHAEIDLRARPSVTGEQVRLGAFVRKHSYGVFVRTDEDGRLVLDSPTKFKSLSVSIQQPGFGPYWAGWTSDEHPETIPDQFVAELDAGWSVGGVVVNEQGAPIEGARVRPSVNYKKAPGDTSQLGVGTRLLTDSAGRWRFDSVPVSNSDVFVEVDHPDYRPLRRRLARVEFGIEGAAEPAGPMELQRGLTVTGRVTDDTGSPISGATIRTKFANDIREAKTDENGRYRLGGCEPSMARLVVFAPGRATDMQEVRIDPDMETVNFQMSPGGKVRVRVLDETGAPVPKARIFFQRWRGDWFQYFEFDHVSQYANEQGVWEWNAAPLDEFRADICPPGTDGMQLVNQSLMAREQEYVFRIPPTLVISGTVIDAETRQPIESFRAVPGTRSDEIRGAPPRLRWDRPESYVATGGGYQIRRSRGELAHLVRIEAEGYQVAVSRVIRSDEGQVRVDFELTKAADLSATVRTPDGRPAAGARIALGIAGSQINIRNGDIDERSTFAAQQDADGDGHFRFPAPADDYQLVITHSTGFAHLKSVDREVPETITLTPWARVEGTFHVGPRTVPKVSITLNVNGVNSYGEDVPNIFTQHDVTTDAEGKFVFERAFPGNGWIGRGLRLIVGEGSSEVTSSKMEPVVLKAGETLDVDLGGFGHAVNGRLTAPAGQTGKVLWNFALVDVVPDVPEPLRDVSTWFTATVAHDGTFRIDDIPPGKYRLSVHFSEHSAGYVADYQFAVPDADDDQARQEIDLGLLTLEGN